MKEMKTKNPKEFWKLINRNKGNSKRTNISIDNLYNFFKNLNEAPNISNEVNEMLTAEIERSE